jgi:hypothetical protein
MILVRAESAARILDWPWRSPFGLVEIGGLGYVREDDRVISANLRDTIHLNGEQHRDAILLQLTCQCDGLRAAPAMTVNDDAAILFLVGG